MSKSHVINLSIANRTGGTLVFVHAWFQTGGLADHNAWPTSIELDGVARVQCCESFASPVGCSGWVQYSLDGAPICFAFSNPTTGSNGIDVGAAPSVWDDMQGHYFPVGRAVRLSNGTWAVAELLSTGGSTNNASWDIRVCDVDAIVPANLEMRGVQAVWENFPVTGTRGYYQCDDDPTPLLGLVKSHFKGLASFADKLIFTHTNLMTQQQNGKNLVADKIPAGWAQGMIDAVYDTQHQGWPHPCSSQACGSFMAMGIQQDEDGPGSKKSQIQILDIRMSQVNQDAKVIGLIDIPDDGINGVGMTKETGAGGRYLVAGINGNRLNVYRSTTSSLITNGVPTVAFERILQQDIEDSGPGLAMVTQSDGAIFIFALNADAGKPSYMNLYKLDLASSPPSCTRVGVKEMQIPGMSESVILLEKYALLAPQPWGTILSLLLHEVGADMLNSSFRWGKGLSITSPDTMEVFASDRNVLPLSHIPLVGSNKDFSLVTWSNKGAPRQIGLPIEASGTWAGSAPGVGMILLEPVAAAGTLTTFNVMLYNRDGGAAGAPVAIVFDRTVDGAGNTTLTVSATSALTGFNPANYATQNLALATPLAVQAGQLVGFVNGGTASCSLNWVDGPAHHVWWIDIVAQAGWSVTLKAGDAGTPVVACGWNFTATPGTAN